jgi:hypothetical protein
MANGEAWSTNADSRVHRMVRATPDERVLRTSLSGHVVRVVLDRGRECVALSEGTWIGRRRAIAIPRAFIDEVRIDVPRDAPRGSARVSIERNDARRVETVLLPHDDAEELAAWIAAFRDDTRDHYRG